MRKVELLPTRDCDAGYGPALVHYMLVILFCSCCFYLSLAHSDFNQFLCTFLLVSVLVPCNILLCFDTVAYVLFLSLLCWSFLFSSSSWFILVLDVFCCPCPLDSH